MVVLPEFHPNCPSSGKVPAQQRMKHSICVPFSEEGSQTAPSPAISVSSILDCCGALRVLNNPSNKVYFRASIL